MVEPKKVEEALLDEDWTQEMQEDLNQFERSKVYVDDIIFGSTNGLMTQEFFNLVSGEFEMSMMGELNFFLGLQIKQIPTSTLIHQQKYVRELLKKFNMSTHIATATKLNLDETCASIDQKMYNGIIGSLLYLTGSRPHIMLSV
ncbi:uncharacterized mitochondrial protein AtMg00810-like [Solanum tuberosum]|uniref:uncharacterized mitochondrial protein AtMg00810-like n=1 Tax=Solanum tuberosum TaxID=4113 RepID=UPI00073A212C|nr:PREDICTED: uncharacterized mitochondrial protein AtMg00810-like [Solanum tuberosum]